MATALCRDNGVRFEGGNLLLSLEVAYAATTQGEVGGYDGFSGAFVDVVIAAIDQPAAIRSKMSAAVVADAKARGFTVVGGDITIPSFQKG